MLRLHAFHGVTGAHLGRLEATSISWSESISEEGSLRAEVRLLPGVRDMLRPYGTIVAAMDGADVVHAGYVVSATPDPGSGTVDVSAGDGWTIFRKRLVLNRALASSWADGTVVIDEDNPPGDWVLHLSGTYSDIARGLVAEAMAWGELPYELPPVDGGSDHERTYNSWDFATVAERLGDLADLDGGPEIRFDPSVDEAWRLSFALRAADEVVDSRWRWNACVPGQSVSLSAIDSDGSGMCSQAYFIGGGEDDSNLMTRATSDALTSAGWPLLQIANTEHSSVSVLATLQSYAAAEVAAGDSVQETFGLRVPATLRVRPGDWADVRLPENAWDGGGPAELKVVDVSGDASSDRIDVQLRRR